MFINLTKCPIVNGDAQVFCFSQTLDQVHLYTNVDKYQAFDTFLGVE